MKRDAILKQAGDPLAIVDSNDGSTKLIYNTFVVRYHRSLSSVSGLSAPGKFSTTAPLTRLSQLTPYILVNKKSKPTDAHIPETWEVARWNKSIQDEHPEVSKRIDVKYLRNYTVFTDKRTGTEYVVVWSSALRIIDDNWIVTIGHGDNISYYNTLADIKRHYIGIVDGIYATAQTLLELESEMLNPDNDLLLALEKISK